MNSKRAEAFKGGFGVVRVGLLVVAAAGALALTACSTVKGAGQDLQDASDGVRDAITD